MAILLSTAVGAVALKEAFEAYEAGIDIARGPYIRKVYLAPSWNVAFDCVNALMGFGVPPVPHRCPESPNLRCLAARLVPRAEYDARDSGRPRFNLPVIEADYGLLSWEAAAQDDPAGAQSFPDDGSPFLFMEHSIDFDTEILKVPGTTYKYATSGKPIDTPFHISVGTALFTIIRHWQEVLPMIKVTQYLNRLNDRNFLGQDVGQIMFRRARTRRSWTSDGTTTQEVEYVFKWREVHHNAVPLPDGRGFDLISDGSGDGPFAFANLGDLLV